MVRASGFPLPLRSPTFPQRCSGASPQDPQSLVLAKGFCSLEQRVFARSSKRSLHARAEGLCSLEQKVFARASVCYSFSISSLESPVIFAIKSMPRFSLLINFAVSRAFRYEPCRMPIIRLSCLCTAMSVS